jgi:hypothetical protein
MDARGGNNFVKALPFVIAALCCVNATASGEEKVHSQTTPASSPAATSSTNFSVPKTRLQWQPLRPSAPNNNASPVRTVRYEQDVFADGPALQATDKANDKTAVKRATLNQTPPKSPFEEPETTPMPTPTPTPVPEHTFPPMSTPTPMETAPTPMPVPTETTPPLEFRPPSAPTPSPTPAPETTFPPRELAPPATTPPSTMFPPPSATIDQFDMG